MSKRTTATVWAASICLLVLAGRASAQEVASDAKKSHRPENWSPARWPSVASIPARPLRSEWPDWARYSKAQRLKRRSVR